MDSSPPACRSRQSGKELVRYRSQGEAASQASALRHRYGKGLVPYRCSRCRYWHLGAGPGNLSRSSSGR